MEIIEYITHIVMNFSIIIMLFWMLFWDSEPINPIRKYWIPKIQHIYIWLGLTAEWRMFSPDPPIRNFWPLIKMTLRNGESVVWEATSTNEMSVFEKFKYKKYHKFYFEVARPKVAYHTKRDFIEYLLHKNNFDQPCEKVEVFMICQNIPDFYDKEKVLGTPVQQLVYEFFPNQ